MLRNQSKKINSPKNQSTQIPLSSILIEIGSLKKQLQYIKTKKSINHNLSHKAQSQINLHTQSTFQSTQQHISLQTIKYKDKDKQLKIDIELNKLKKYINRPNKQFIVDQLNTLIQIVNSFNQQLTHDLQNYKERYFQAKIQNQNIIADNNHTQYSNKYIHLLKINEKLQSEVKQLKNTVIQMTQKYQPQSCVTQVEEELNIIYQQKQQLLLKNQQLNSIIIDYSNQLATANQKIKIYQITLQQKQEHLILMDQNINYLRIQSQKFRVNKKQIETLYQQTNKSYKQLQIVSQSQINRLISENSKLKYQLNLRKSQTQQIIEIESQKNILYRQVQQLRNQLEKKTIQISEIKNLFYQQQKKTLVTQSQLYRWKAQCQKLLKNAQLSQTQLLNLHKQVQELYQYNQSMKNYQVKKYNNKQGKANALNQIQQMIKKHKLQNINL